MRISSPERVARLLEQVAQSNLPLLVRALSLPAIAVKGRAIPIKGAIADHGFKIGSISDRGLKFLSENSSGGIMVEFVLMSSKVEFYTTIATLSEVECTVSLPNYLLSIERRKNARFQVAGNARAFMSIDSWEPDAEDLATVPFFESSSELGSLIPVGDVSLGGISLVSRFPSICKVFDRTPMEEIGQFYLPMSSPISIEGSIRWSKRVKEILPDDNGGNRVVRSYSFGVQFMNPSEELLKDIQVFIQKASQAEAI